MISLSRRDFPTVLFLARLKLNQMTRVRITVVSDYSLGEFYSPERSIFFHTCDMFECVSQNGCCGLFVYRFTAHR